MRAIHWFIALALLVGPSVTAAAQEATPPTLPPGASDDLVFAPLPEDWSERHEELHHRIEAANTKEGDLLAQLEQSDKRRQELDLAIADLERQVAGLNAQLGVLRGDLDRTTFAYVSAEREAEDATYRLSDVRGRVARRALRMYKEGPAAFASFVLGARTLEDAETRVSYVRRVVESDKVLLRHLVAAEAEQRVRSVRLDGLKTDQFERVNRVASVQEEISAAASRQKKAREEIEKEASTKRRLLVRIQSDRAAWQAMVGRQQQDSLGVADLVARYQAGQVAAPGVIPGMFVLPVIGEIASGFGWRLHPIFGATRFHAGVDLSAGEGTPIRSPADGTVLYTGWMGGYGNTTVVDHGKRIATLHAHQVTAPPVSAGQPVKRGDVIGYVGSTGYSTGPHLHFEVRLDGEPTDPLAWLRLA